jgi:GTP-binding protein LepA
MSKEDLGKIRNFCIIAHIDHGKSTLSDKILLHTKTISQRDEQNQILDSMDIEREKGITIKSSAINIEYKTKDKQIYTLNLIDTPGHVDFGYEVSRSLACCEGALLLVDASQGVQAQTLANLYKAMELDLVLIPVINKIDLPSADLEGAIEQIDNELGLDPESIILTSAKDGIGIEETLNAIIERIPTPRPSEVSQLRALIFDCHYDSYRGAIVYCRIFDGQIKRGDEIRLMASDTTYKVEEVGVFRLGLVPKPILKAGDVGYIIAGIKSVSDAKTGDTG